MLLKTRSDLIIEVARRNQRMVEPPDELVAALHRKIENVYGLLFEMEAIENKDGFTDLVLTLAQRLRKELES